MIAPVTSSQPISNQSNASQATAQTVSMGQMLASQAAVARPELQRAVNQSKEAQKRADHPLMGPFMDREREQLQNEEMRVNRRSQREDGQQKKPMEQQKLGSQEFRPGFPAGDAQLDPDARQKTAQFKRRATAEPARTGGQRIGQPQVGQRPVTQQAPTMNQSLQGWFTAPGGPSVAEQRASDVTQLWQGMKPSALAESAQLLVGKTVIVARLASGLARFAGENDDLDSSPSPLDTKRGLAAYQESLKTARSFGATDVLFDQTFQRLAA